MPNPRRTFPWTTAGPVALVAAAVLAVLWFDITEGGGTEPEGFIGEIRTPVRSAFIEPTPLPPGARPTVSARPTIAPSDGPAPVGTAEERDGERKADLVLLLGAANQLRERDGSYPSTNNNVQTLCSYEQQDVACALRDVLPALPIDPLGDAIRNGYWYSSDGETVRFYAALEGAVPEDQLCDTSDAELTKRQNVICIEGP
jgi:hypothetical protein